jgi:hypothetical protein
VKPIIGILRESECKIKDLSKKGYRIEYINDHVKRVGGSLFKRKLTDSEISEIRDKGYEVSSRFWVNLALFAISNDDRNNLKIAIADLQEKDNKSIFSKII